MHQDGLEPAAIQFMLVSIKFNVFKAFCSPDSLFYEQRIASKCVFAAMVCIYMQYSFQKAISGNQARALTVSLYGQMWVRTWLKILAVNILYLADANIGNISTDIDIVLVSVQP